MTKKKAAAKKAPAKEAPAKEKAAPTPVVAPDPEPEVERFTPSDDPNADIPTQFRNVHLPIPDKAPKPEVE